MGEPGQVEPDGGQVPIGRKHRIAGVEQPAGRGQARLDGGVSRLLAEFHLHPLAGHALGLEVSGDGEAVVGKDPGRRDQIGHPHIGRERLAADAHRVDRDLGPAGSGSGGERIDAGVASAVGEQDDAGKRGGRLPVEHPQHRLAQSGFVSAGQDGPGPVARRLGSPGDQGERFRLGVESPQGDLVCPADGRQQSAPGKDLNGLRGSIRRRPGRGSGRCLIDERHAGARVDQHRHPGRHHDLMFRDPLEIQDRDGHRRQGGQPQQ